MGEDELVRRRVPEPDTELQGCEHTETQRHYTYPTHLSGIGYTAND